MAQLVFDEKLGERMEVLYRTGDYVRRRRLVYEALGASPGDRLLDVGCGPGFLSSELLDQVGEEGSVLGLDMSPAMLAVAAHRCEGRPNVRFEEAEATALPVNDGEFDRALSVQVLEYVTDVDRALSELHRALRPGGRVVVWDIDWATLSWHSAEPERMRRMLAAWDEHLADPWLPRSLARRLRAAGFSDVRMQGHAFATTEFEPDAFCSALLPLIEGYLAKAEGVDRAEAEAWAAEQHELGERGEFYFECIQSCFTGIA